MAGLNLLLVEDNPADAKLLRVWLGRSPVIARIDEVAAGREALRQVREGRAMAGRTWPDLILLDSQLPDMTGLELLAELATAKMGADRVLMLTGSHRPDDARRASELGAIGYLMKPFDAAEFEQLVLRVEAFARTQGTTS